MGDDLAQMAYTRRPWVALQHFCNMRAARMASPLRIAPCRLGVDSVDKVRDRLGVTFEHQSVPGDRQLHRYVVAPVVAHQAQGQAMLRRCYPLSHLYGHFGLVRLTALGHDVPWVKT